MFWYTGLARYSSQRKYEPLMESNSQSDTQKTATGTGNDVLKETLISPEQITPDMDVSTATTSTCDEDDDDDDGNDGGGGSGGNGGGGSGSRVGGGGNGDDDDNEGGGIDDDRDDDDGGDDVENSGTDEPAEGGSRSFGCCLLCAKEQRSPNLQNPRASNLHCGATESAAVSNVLLRVETVVFWWSLLTRRWGSFSTVFFSLLLAVTTLSIVLLSALFVAPTLELARSLCSSES